jgi:Putative secretion activating protein
VDSLIRATSSTAATKQLTVDERLNELFQQYGIQAEAVDEARSEMDEPEPVVINTPGVFPTVIPEAVADSESDKWDRCISIVGIAEGGANFDVVNGQPVLKASAKNDKGGLTKHGITQGTLASAYAKGVVSHNGIVALTRDEAKHIYRTMYCDPYGWLELPFAACLCLLDATINHGLGGTARIAQRTCNALAKQEILVVDGKWGPKTRAAVWSMVEGHLEPEGCSQIFAAEFLKWRKDYFDRIIAADSSQAVFRNGWYNRLKMLAKECDVESPV